MTVNPDEILIFKMRGMKTAQKKRPEAALIPQPQAVKQERKPFFAPREVPKPEEPVQKPTIEKPKETPQKQPSFFARAPKPIQKPALEKPKGTPQEQPPPFVPTPKPVLEAAEKPALEKPVMPKERKPLFTFKPKPKPIPAKAAQPERKPEAVEKMAWPEYSEEDETRLRELENLEQTAALYEAPLGGLEAEEVEARGTLQGKEVRNIFSTIAGLLFIADALIFGYFIFPQSAFVLNYVAHNGLGSIAVSSNYEYGIAFVNIILVLLLIISGGSMVTHAKLSHLVSGATGSIILLSVSFEYLNSNAVYLLLVSVITFISVVTLAYARMSSVMEVEQEEQEEMPTRRDINWPRLETF